MPTNGDCVTFYESNREVRPVGDEVAEFVTEPEPRPPAPPGAEDEADEPDAAREDAAADGAAAREPS